MTKGQWAEAETEEERLFLHSPVTVTIDHEAWQIALAYLQEQTGQPFPARGMPLVGTFRVMHAIEDALEKHDHERTGR
jgi:hypothetical protein